MHLHTLHSLCQSTDSYDNKLGPVDVSESKWTVPCALQSGHVIVIVILQRKVGMTLRCVQSSCTFSLYMLQQYSEPVEMSTDTVALSLRARAYW
jgi:hypothetical protein